LTVYKVFSAKLSILNEWPATTANKIPTNLEFSTLTYVRWARISCCPNCGLQDDTAGYKSNV